MPFTCPWCQNGQKQCNSTGDSQGYIVDELSHQLNPNDDEGMDWNDVESESLSQQQENLQPQPIVRRAGRPRRPRPQARNYNRNLISRLKRQLRNQDKTCSVQINKSNLRILYKQHKQICLKVLQSYHYQDCYNCFTNKKKRRQYYKRRDYSERSKKLLRFLII